MLALASRFFRLRWLAAATTVLLIATGARAAPSPVGVAVLHAAAWSPGDRVREGAGEFEVFLRIAQLQRIHTAAGLVSVGDRNGFRQGGGELALRRAALTGVPVVKLAPGGEVAPTPDDLFIDAGRLSPEHASRVLVQCLTRFGPAPVAADPDRPTKKELAAIHAHVQRFQAAFAIEHAPLVAAQ